MHVLNLYTASLGLELFGFSSTENVFIHEDFDAAAQSAIFDLGEWIGDRAGKAVSTGMDYRETAVQRPFGTELDIARVVLNLWGIFTPLLEFELGLEPVIGPGRAFCICVMIRKNLLGLIELKSGLLGERHLLHFGLYHS